MKSFLYLCISILLPTATSFQAIHYAYLSQRKSPSLMHVEKDSRKDYLNASGISIRNRSQPKQGHFHPLYLSPTATDSILALSTIAISSSIGFISDRKNLLGGNAGTIITLSSAALLSNIGFFGLTVPTSHVIYDVCWTKLLPASLALVLLSASSDSDDNEQGDLLNEEGPLSAKYIEPKVNHKNIIMACAVPFWIGALGSMMGCLLSAIISARYQFMKPFEAAIAAGKDTKYIFTTIPNEGIKPVFVTIY